MPHVFDPNAEERTDAGADGGGTAGAGSRVAVRLLGCAIAMLVVSFLVVNRSSGALRTDAAAASSSFASGVLALHDDDRGRTLFDFPALVPGQSGERCIQVVYEGTIDQAAIVLRADGDGELARALGFSVEAGSGGSFDDCSGFTPAAQLFDGTLADFLAEHGRRSAGLPAFTTGAGQTARTFRFRFRLDDGFAAQGASARADFLWTATPVG